MLLLAAINLISMAAQGDATQDVATYEEILAGVREGQFITATATDSAGNTSEFALSIIVTTNRYRWRRLANV